MLTTDGAFFHALLTSDYRTLDELLVDDFIIVDVMTGTETNKATLVEAVRSGRLRFLTIDPSEVRARTYGAAAVVNGRTLMSLSFDGTSTTVKSRYTHVYVTVMDRWRMISAQGTAIAE